MTAIPLLVDSSIELHGRVAVLTFERDDVRNALTGTCLVEDLLTAIDWANRTHSISVLVLTGAGKAFSAGGNIKQMRDKEGIFSGSPLQVERGYRYGIQLLPRAMRGIDIPVIAAVNGAAIGAGFDLANMCDLRLASNLATFGETFINLGIVPGDGGAWYLQRLIGYQNAAELILSGRILSADDALKLGLLLEVTEPDRLLDRALQLAQAIAAKPPQAVRQTKRLLRLAERHDLPDYLDFCAAFQAMAHQTADHGEAVAAFLEKRPPQFKGD